MRNLLFATLVSTSLFATAHADGDVTATAREKVKVGIAFNPPLRWVSDGTGKAYAASLYVGLDKHHVLRGNVARYPFGPSIIGMLGSESSFEGDVTDFGASYMYFPRRAFDGFVAEAGLLYRMSDGLEHGPFSDDTTTKTTFFAGRALIGWSWLLDDWLFVSIQVGGSAGYERGTISVCDESGLICMEQGGPTVTRVKQMTTAPEAFMRIGVAFGL